MSRDCSYIPPEKKPKTKEDMAAYLAGHFRYRTANSWNASTSYARCVKLRYIEFPSPDVENVAYDVIGADDEWWEEAEIAEEIHTFDRRHDYLWQIGTNGRSGGYMVLYRGFSEPSGYHSFCSQCGQQNCTLVADPKPPVLEGGASQSDILRALEWAFHRSGRQTRLPLIADEGKWAPNNHYHDVRPVITTALGAGWTAEAIADRLRSLSTEVADGRRPRWSFDNICGRCNAPARRNYENRHMKVGVHPGRGTDMHEDFSGWSRSALASRVDVVWGFDRAVDRCIRLFVDYCRGHRVVEKTIMVPKTVRVCVSTNDEPEGAGDA